MVRGLFDVSILGIIYDNASHAEPLYGHNIYSYDEAMPNSYCKQQAFSSLLVIN
jgi:hypothetical protein